MAEPTGPVHFIYLGGEFCWQHLRAVKTARRHGAPIVLWSATSYVPGYGEIPDVEVRPLDLPDWLRDHPIQLANVKDLFAWRILYEHGGLYLDLDTISLRPAWDLLTADVCVSTEAPSGETWEHPYNSAVVLARKGAPVLDWMRCEAEEFLSQGESRWGKTGPHLLTGFVDAHPETFSPAPFGALNGWSYHTIGDYYANPRNPGVECRVIHLYSSDHLDEFHGDRWWPS